MIEAIKKRRSVRKYEDTPVSEVQLQQVLDTAMFAASWANKQGWQILVVRGEEKRAKVAAAIEGNPGGRAVGQAPVLIVVCMDPEQSGSPDGRDYYMTDAGILMDHLMLQAAEIGLGTVFIGMFDEGKVRAALDIPERYRICALTPLGVPAKIPGERPRNTVEEIVHWEKW